MTDELPCGCERGWIFCEEAKELYAEADRLYRIWWQTQDLEDGEKYEAAKKQYNEHRKGLTS